MLGFFHRPALARSKRVKFGAVPRVEFGAVPSVAPGAERALPVLRCTAIGPVRADLRMAWPVATRRTFRAKFHAPSLG